MNAPQRFDRCLLIDPTMRCDNEDAAKCCQGTADLKCPCDCHRTEKDSEIEQLEGELSRLRAINAELLAALDGLAEVADLAPEPHCSCHNAPPCGDCVEWGGLREALKDSRALLTRAKGETT